MTRMDMVDTIALVMETNTAMIKERVVGLNSFKLHAKIPAVVTHLHTVIQSFVKVITISLLNF